MIPPFRKRLWKKSASAEEPGSEVILQRRLELRRRALTAGSIIVLAILLSLRNGPEQTALRVGSISAHEVRAGHSAFYVDLTRTHRLQETASADVLPIYRSDEQADARAERNGERIFEAAEAERTALASGKGRYQARLHNALASSQFNDLLPRPALQRLLTLPNPAFKNLETITLKALKNAMDREIRNNKNDRAQAVDDADDAVAASLSSHQDRVVAHMALDQAIGPNYLYDARLTQRAREKAAAAVKPYVGRVLVGERIVGAGEVVTQEDMDKLAGLGLVSSSRELSTNIAIVLLSTLMVLLVAYYIARHLPSLHNDLRRLGLLAAIMCLGILGSKAGVLLFGLEMSGGQPGYLGLASVTAAGMLVAALLDAHLALLIVALLSVQSGLLMNHDIRFAVITLISSLVGIASVRSSRRQNRLPAAMTALAVGNVSMVWLMGLLFADSLTDMVRSTFWALGAVLVAAALYSLGSLFLERLFGLLTPSVLMELSATDHPILQKLCAAAPGTYAHSMMVGALGEAAARVVGADSMLCRVGGYFHDIGKINQPEYFVENQRQENIHTRLSPSLSALIIIAHVRDGITLAREARLPDEITDIIAQHHGTTLISYFYHRALADNGGSDTPPPGLEQRFRYPGPRPRTREAAIIMLADSIEAACRCLDRPDEEQLHDQVTKIVRGKIEDGQLDECPLTFRDIRLITDAFLQQLQAMAHRRIDYRTAAVPIQKNEKARMPAGASSSETLREITVHLTAASRPDGPSSLAITSLPHTEALYDDPDTPSFAPEGVHTPAETGGEPLAQGRRPRRRRGEHSAHR